MKYHVPTTAQAWLGESISQVDNFHLLLNRFLQFDDSSADIKAWKFGGLEVNGLHESFRFSGIPFQHLCQEIKTAAVALHGADHQITSTYQTVERLILGAASVLENSLRLHHIWGFPFIPGSSIKGLVRAYTIATVFDDKEEEARADRAFQLLFGFTEETAQQETASQGNLTFYDALPSQAVKLSVDIMNPHYQEYFSGNAPPADYLSPIPIFFLTIDKGNRFQFSLGYRARPQHDWNTAIQGSRLNNYNNYQTPIHIAEALLAEALAEEGIGGKTSVGYGFMEKN